MQLRTAIKSLTAAVLLGAASGGAFAADLAMRPVPQMPAAPPVYNWTGLYVGVNGGGAWGTQDPLNVISDRFDSFSTGISGGLFGGTVGGQVQVQHVVFGLEADLDWANIKGSAATTPAVGGNVIGGTFNAQTKVDWESTVRLRLGYANNNWLFYATGGLAIQEAKTTLTSPGGVSGCQGVLVNCSGANRQFGGALGAGVEYGFTPNLSGKIEYLYVTAASLDVSHQNQIRAGLNYRFGM